MKKNILKHFKLADYILMAMIASMGIAVKVIIVPLAHIITGPLFIPGGVVAGGFYMGFLVLGAAIIQKPGTATMIALIQAVVVTITGVLGSHGAASLFTYTLPGIGVDLLLLLIRHKGCCPLCCFLAGLMANMIGSFAVNLAIFHLPFVPLMLALCTAALFGGLGGLGAYAIAKNVRKLGILGGKEENTYTVPLPKKEVIEQIQGVKDEKV